MADEKDSEKQTDSEQEKTDEKTVEKKSGIGLLQWIIVGIVVAVCAGSGFGLGRLLAGPRTPETTESSQQDEPAPPEDIKPDSSAAGTEKVWYYPLEPVVANLDEPGVTRYVRATLILAIKSQVDQKKTVLLLEEKKPILANWLTIHLASLSLDDIRGDKNLRRVQSQVLDAFNEKLFPNTKPQIEKILFKEFAVQ